MKGEGERKPEEGRGGWEGEAGRGVVQSRV